MKPDTVYTTYSNGDGSASLKSLEPVKMTEASAADTRTIVIDETVTGRAMLGMGGTWTDTDVYNLLRMSKAKQDEVLTALFDKDKGAGWNFMRLPFGSTDWESTCDYYTYCDMPRGEKDWDLKNFSIKRDIGRGFFNLARRCTEIDPGVIFLASVWGVPGWMKENDSIMFGRFDAACTDVYAKYLRMAVQAYAEQGVKLHALTTQNEPLTGDGRATPACRFTWRMQKGVITALRREFDAHGIDTEIWIYDHNFDMADVFVAPLLEDAEARAAFDGVAFHDYGGSPEVMGELARKYPDIPFYMTERFIASVSDMDNLVQQLRNGAQSYIQWKTMTDEYSGPHQFLGRPFIYRRPTRQEYLPFVYNMKDDADDWRKAPSYGLYAQFTKFLRRGMKRVDCTGGCREFITAAAFADDKRKIVLVAVNQTDAEQPFTLRIGGAEAALVMPPQSVASHEIMPGGLCGKKTFKVNDCPQMQKPAPDAFDITPAEIIMRGEKKEGEEISFACRIKNIGSLPTASNATLCVLFQLDGDTDIARATVCIPPLPPGGETIIEANIPFGKKTTWTAEAGWHTFFAVAEIGNCKPEANTDNNRLGTEVYFQNIGG